MKNEPMKKIKLKRNNINEKYSSRSKSNITLGIKEIIPVQE